MLAVRLYGTDYEADTQAQAKGLAKVFKRNLVEETCPRIEDEMADAVAKGENLASSLALYEGAVDVDDEERRRRSTVIQ